MVSKSKLERRRKYSARDYSGLNYPFHVRKHPHDDQGDQFMRSALSGDIAGGDTSWINLEQNYPSEMYEPRDSHFGGTTMETLALIGALIGAGVAVVAVIVYVTKKATETGEQVVESLP
jgi:hypothetical protein